MAPAAAAAATTRAVTVEIQLWDTLKYWGCVCGFVEKMILRHEHVVFPGAGGGGGGGGGVRERAPGEGKVRLTLAD